MRAIAFDRRTKFVLSLCAVAIALLSSFWLWPSLACKVLGQSFCKCGDCCDKGPVEGRTVRTLYSCQPLASGSCQEQWSDVAYTCNGPGCSYSWEQGKCNTYANGCLPLLPNRQVVHCCGDEPPPPLDTPVPTNTPAPLPLAIDLSVQYEALLYYGPRLGQPAQVIFGAPHDGAKPYKVKVYVESPSGIQHSYAFENAEAIKLEANAGRAGDTRDTYFGTDEEGTWTAWAEVYDSRGNSAISRVISWTVSWYPIHARP